jgi:hypothetical protein
VQTGSREGGRRIRRRRKNKKKKEEEVLNRTTFILRFQLKCVLHCLDFTKLMILHLFYMELFYTEFQRNRPRNEEITRRGSFTVTEQIFTKTTFARQSSCEEIL